MDIKPVSTADRNLGGIDFFFLWAGVAISLAEIWAGGFLAPLGFWTGVWAILLGHIIGNTLMALGGVIGSDHGIMSMVSVRPAFGIRGSNLAAVLNIIQLIGWAAIMLIIGGRAGAALGAPVGGFLATDAFWIVSIGLTTLVWALLTGRTVWKILQTLAVIALSLVILMMSWVSFTGLEKTATETAAEPMAFMIGLDLVIAMPISWMPLVADYSRFSRNTGPTFWNTWLGYFLVSSWMYILGLQVTLMTGVTDPGFLILDTMGKIGFAAPALAMVVFSTITSDFPDVYSATCSALNISQKVSSKTIMWIAGTLAILVALVFPMEQYENFLLFIGAMFVPLFGVVLTDYFIVRKRQLNMDDLFRDSGRYWYFNGYNLVAMISWVVGFAVFEGIAIAEIPIGASIPSMLSAGIVYLVLTRSKN